MAWPQQLVGHPKGVLSTDSHYRDRTTPGGRSAGNDCVGQIHLSCS